MKINVYREEIWPAYFESDRNYTGSEQVELTQAEYEGFVNSLREFNRYQRLIESKIGDYE